MDLELEIKKTENPADVDDVFDSTTGIAYYIAKFAHRNQHRVNGEGYFQHPLNCYNRFIKWLLIDEDDGATDAKLLWECRVPYFGVAETCLLHDVLEDTEITADEIRAVYAAHGYGDFCDEWILPALLAVTHKEEDSYDEYIEKVLQNPVAAMVKMIDLSDNLNPLTLLHIEDKEVERAKRYLTYVKRINDVYGFTENVTLYRFRRGQEA